MAIPKIIHQTWKSTNVPEKWLGFQQKVKDLHPDWEYRLWTDEDNDIFIAQHYPDLLANFRAYPRPVMRADVIRYAIMDQIGGFYLDLDYEVIKPLDEWLAHPIVLPKSRDMNEGDADDRIGNCILGSETGHDFWKYTINHLKNQSSISVDQEIEVEKATGPYLLTQLYQEKNWQDIVTPERSAFHPPSPRTHSQYKSIIDQGKAFGIHHAHGSWRQPQWKKLINKLFRKG